MNEWISVHRSGDYKLLRILKRIEILPYQVNIKIGTILVSEILDDSE
jgi:hypothetical protein